MEVLKSSGEPEAFFTRVAAAAKSALLLDYDGTLAPFRVEPREALPYPGVQERVAEIAGSGRTRVVFVTGRAIADFLPLLSMDPMPEVWGCHGWERRYADGRYECVPPPDDLARLLVAAAEATQALGETVRCERKPYSVAVHWRGMPADTARQIEAQTREAWLRLMSSTADVALKGFDGGLELRIEGRTKADAVRTLMGEIGGTVPVAFLGDDLTDEDAFGVLPADGLGVLVRSERRATAAKLWLQPPGELLWFLDRWGECVGRRG